MSKNIKLKNLVKEQMSSDKYIIEAIRDFISSSDTSSPYKPQIKLNWGGDNGQASTKWLSITWDDALGILEYFEEK